MYDDTTFDIRRNMTVKARTTFVVCGRCCGIVMSDYL